jgi:outer membrane receptor protein involved in Fe transport
VLGDPHFEPNPKRAGLLYLTDNVTWTCGAHSIRFGGDTRRMSQFSGQSAPGAALSRGLYIFTGLLTGARVGLPGSAMADLLLGQTTRARLSAYPDADLRNDNYGFYFNDTWKATPRLTLNLGLRYEVQSPPWEANQQAANFDLNPGSPTYGTIVIAKDGSIRDRSFVNLDMNNFAPRLG